MDLKEFLKDLENANTRVVYAIDNFAAIFNGKVENSFLT